MSEAKKFVPAVNTPGFYVGIVFTFLAVIAIKNWWPESIPFDVFQFFTVKWDLSKLTEIPIFFMAIGPIATLVVSVLTRNGRQSSIQILEKTSGNIVTSIKAGIFEEVSFRWLGFLLAIFTFGAIQNVTNSLTENSTWQWITSNLWIAVPLTILTLIGLNVVGIVAYTIIADTSIHGCIVNLIAFIIMVAVVVIDIAVFFIVFWSWTRWLYSQLIPIIDTLTQSKLHEQLFGYGWAVGAALVSVNWSFGNGHSYQGCLGFVNSWIIGMIMFWIMFNFGLPVAMLLHAGYDVTINLIRAGDAVVELGNHAS